MPQAPGIDASLPAPELAPALLGSWLCVRRGKVVDRYRISETEAYQGRSDLACHACRGRTPRNSVMFGPPGIWYVYLCYGMHWMLNLVCDGEGEPAAVLIRGLDEISGPGRLTRRLGIDLGYDGLEAKPSTGLWIEAGVPPPRIVSGPRIGIDRVPEPWRSVLWNFRADHGA